MKETFGQRFARLRKAKDLKQEDIASKVNISPQAVSKWENDISSPDIFLLSDLADIFGVTIDELLGKEKEKTIEVVPIQQRKNINNMILKVRVIDGKDKVSINIPVSIIKVSIEAGMNLPQISGNSTLKNIDFEQIFQLIDQGVIGKLIEVESEDGTIVEIFVE